MREVRGNMKKRILAVLLAAATAISTSACKAPAGQESTGAEKTEAAESAENRSMKADPVTIHYFAMPTAMEQMNRLFQIFKRSIHGLLWS